jgi:hypothetical protein
MTRQNIPGKLSRIAEIIERQDDVYTTALVESDITSLDMSLGLTEKAVNSLTRILAELYKDGVKTIGEQPPEIAEPLKRICEVARRKITRELERRENR